MDAKTPVGTWQLVCDAACYSCPLQVSPPAFQSHAGKVVLRSWYEKNKHIFPASRWEPYDPEKKWDKYTVRGAWASPVDRCAERGQNQFFRICRAHVYISSTELHAAAPLTSLMHSSEIPGIWPLWGTDLGVTSPPCFSVGVTALWNSEGILLQEVHTPPPKKTPLK